MKMKNLLITAIAIFGLATTTFAQVPNYVPTNGLVGWWGFNGNANDESGNGLHCTVFGNVSLTTDRDGNPNSAYLWPSNGSSSNYMFLPNFTSYITNSYSISFWMLMDGGSLNPRIMSKGEWIIGTNGINNTSRTMIFGGGLVGGTGITQLNVGPVYGLEWVHVVWTADGSSTSGGSKVYFNGILHSTSCCHDGNINPNWTSVNPSDFNIGRKSTSAFDGWGGKLDDIGIWNRVLDSEEVAKLYSGCSLELTVQPNSQQININNNADFTVSSSEPQATYQWQTDLGVGFQNLNNVGQYSGTTTSTLTVDNVTMSNNNEPFRCVITSSSCSDTSEVAVLTVINNVGINEFTQDYLFSVYPNPAHSQINVKVDATLLGSVYNIYDNIGKVVLSGEIIAENTVIELGNLSRGIYVFSVGEKMKQNFKVVKE